MSANKVKRGYYELTFTLISDTPKEEANGDIITKSALLLEKEIKNNPAYWLWSHKRWKHKPYDGVKVNESL